MEIIELVGVHKDYRRLRGGVTHALDGLDLAVRSGGIFGFLGPNGAGKTTTIRCLLGLESVTEGSCRILGVDPSRDLHEVIQRIGSIVEGPALFPNSSGRRNLELLAGIYGIGSDRIDHVLATVRLEDRQRDLYKTYSMGMRQRLAIAAALLKDPELLILDEPTNGLDPAGIREVRQLLRRLADDGRTVLISSHILSEVEQLCDEVGILARGRCVVQGPVADVLSGGASSKLIIRIEDADAAALSITAAGFSFERPTPDCLVVDADARVSAPIVLKALAAKGLFPFEVRAHKADLETVFLELTGDDHEEVAA